MSRPRILIVDDSPIVLETLPEVLGGSFEVETSDNPMLIASTLRHGKFDLLLLDVDMPALSGPQAISALRRSDFLTNTLVVLYTARPHDTLDALAKETGATAAIPKDLTHPELIERLNDILSSGTRRFAVTTGERRAVVFSKPPLEAQILDLLAQLDVEAEARGVLGVDRVVRASDVELVVFESAAFEDLGAVLARLHRRKATEGKTILVIGECPGEACIEPASLTKKRLETVLTRALTKSPA